LEGPFCVCFWKVAHRLNVPYNAQTYGPQARKVISDDDNNDNNNNPALDIGIPNPVVADLPEVDITFAVFL
jgi:hypothetical protein